MGDNEVTDREGADLSLTAWRTDQGTVKEGTAKETLSFGASTMAMIAFGYARRSRPEGGRNNGCYRKQVALCLRRGAICRSFFHVRPRVQGESKSHPLIHAEHRNLTGSCLRVETQDGDQYVPKVNHAIADATVTKLGGRIAWQSWRQHLQQYRLSGPTSKTLKLAQTADTRAFST